MGWEGCSPFRRGQWRLECVAPYFRRELLRGRDGEERGYCPFLLGAASENEGAAPRDLGVQYPKFLSFYGVLLGSSHFSDLASLSNCESRIRIVSPTAVFENFRNRSRS